MSWNTIVRIDPTATPAPVDGARICWRPLRRKGAPDAGYISIVLGAAIARELGLAEEKQRVRLLLGENNDAGKLAIVADAHGDFFAVGKLGKPYKVAIGGKTIAAMGFSSTFASFDRPRLEVVKPVNGQPRMVAFLLTRQFLGQSDD